MTTTETHEHDTDGKFGSCRRCYNEADEADHALTIEARRYSLANALLQATAAIESALRDVRALASDEVYDVELAEGSAGEYAITGLTHAAVLIRGVKAIVPEVTL